MFLSALVDVAGHASRADAAFEIIKDVRAKGFHVGIMTYSSCMGACCNVSFVVNCLMKKHPRDLILDRTRERRLIFAFPCGSPSFSYTSLHVWCKYYISSL